MLHVYALPREVGGDFLPETVHGTHCCRAACWPVLFIDAICKGTSDLVPIAPVGGAFLGSL